MTRHYRRPRWYRPSASSVMTFSLSLCLFLLLIVCGLTLTR